MTNNFFKKEQIRNPESLAKHFSRLGWIGFWIQLALLSADLLLVLYVVFLASPESVQRKGIDHYLQVMKVLLIALGPVLAVILVDMRDRYGWWAIGLGAAVLLYSLWETARS